MNDQVEKFNITQDDLSHFQNRGAAFVAFGETMIRDTPSDMQRPESTRQVYISMAGSEFSIAILLARLGIPSAYITRIPNNPYGWMLRDTARAQGVNVNYLVWAPQAEPMGRYIFEPGRTPRAGMGWYQRMYSAASRLGAGMVDWSAALKDCRIFHTSGITFGLAVHSGYDCNHLLEAFREAMSSKPEGCLVGLDFNYRSTLWSEADCNRTMQPLITEHVDILITSIHDMARHFGIGCGRYSAEEVSRGSIGELDDEAIRAFCQEVIRHFELQILAITLRRSESSEYHEWESAAMTREGMYYRSSKARPIVIMDRLGGGDAWNGGFYYGLLTGGVGQEGIEKGVIVGDSATRLKQTLMFDLPMITTAEIQALIEAEIAGSTHHTIR
ncbi:MAG: sugar kinase [Anaerolineae bacterium]|nr:sugar kinase [Anaerolineae bacterium]